jgi:succinoglycan biosynthesis transport protein ExoP
VDLRRLIALVRSWLPLLVVAAVLSGGAGYLVSRLQPKVYEAATTLLVGQALSTANPDYTQLLVAQSLTSTYATVGHTRPMMEAVIKDLGLQTTPDDLSARVRVEAPRDTTTLTITAQDSDPAMAAKIANSLSSALVAASASIQGRDAAFQKSIDDGLVATQNLIEATQQQVDQLVANPDRTPKDDATLESLQGRLASLRSTYATLLGFSSGAATNLLTVIEPAVAPASPVLPRTLLNTLLAGALGLIVVFGVAFIADQLDDSIKDADAVRDVTGLSTLGTIARMRSHAGRSEIYQLAAILYPRSTVSEAYRTLRSNIEFAAVDGPVRTLLVTSASPQEGKSVTAANLAAVYAQAGRTVLLVDADLRSPSIDRLFRLDNTRGLTTLLGTNARTLGLVTHATEQENLRVLTSGPLPPNPAELLASHRMQGLLKTLEESADIVIFDSPPLHPVTDAAVLSSFVDGTIMVVDAKRSRRRLVRLAREALGHAGATTLGVVLNRASSADKAYGQYYGREEAVPASSDPGIRAAGTSHARAVSADLPDPTA